jgi:hypothetical protein
LRTLSVASIGRLALQKYVENISGILEH